jgi:C1A family cysteine protease
MKPFLFLLAVVFSVAAPAADFYIHPEILEAIKSPPPVSADPLRPTGYRPTLRQYIGARFVHLSAPSVVEIPKEFSLRQLSYSPVRGQLYNDCWAQGAVSAFELTVNFLDKTQKLFSVQDVIDCSGYGSAARGGQLSMRHFEKGAAYHADYPYRGRDQRCNRSVPRHEKASRTFFLRGAKGGFPTMQELQTAVIEYGALEVCGASSTLGRGGRQDNVRSGRTDHCYALTGWVDGKERGWLDATYLEIKNSWGDCNKQNPHSNNRCWGEGGYGYYPLAKADGVRLRGSVITEIQGVEYKP